MRLGIDSDQMTVSAHLCDLRDDLLLLVAAYNSIGHYDVAIEAQALVIAIDKFEDDHNFSTTAWPPRKDPDDPSELVWIQRGD